MVSVSELDLRAEMFIPIPIGLVEKLGMRDAYVLAAIRFRTNTKHVDTVEDEDGIWWRTTANDLASFLGVSVSQVRVALKSLLDSGVLLSRTHAANGWTDRTLSYRLHLSDSDTSMCSKSTSHIHSNQTDVPLVLKNLNKSSPIFETESTDQHGPGLLPETWQPTGKHRVKAESLGVDLDAAVDAMRKWAYVGDKRRKNWNATFNQFIAHQKPTVVTASNAVSDVDRLINAGDAEGLEKLTGMRFTKDFGDVSPRERFQLESAEWPVWARENRQKLINAAVSHSAGRK